MRYFPYLIVLLLILICQPSTAGQVVTDVPSLFERIQACTGSTAQQYLAIAIPSDFCLSCNPLKLRQIEAQLHEFADPETPIILFIITSDEAEYKWLAKKMAMKSAYLMHSEYEALGGIDKKLPGIVFANRINNIITFLPLGTADFTLSDALLGKVTNLILSCSTLTALSEPSDTPLMACQHAVFSAAQDRLLIHDPVKNSVDTYSSTGEYVGSVEIVTDNVKELKIPDSVASMWKVTLPPNYSPLKCEALIWNSDKENSVLLLGLLGEYRVTIDEIKGTDTIASVNWQWKKYLAGFKDGSIEILSAFPAEPYTIVDASQAIGGKFLSTVIPSQGAHLGTPGVADSTAVIAEYTLQGQYVRSICRISDVLAIDPTFQLVTHRIIRWDGSLAAMFDWQNRMLIEINLKTGKLVRIHPSDLLKSAIETYSPDGDLHEFVHDIWVDNDLFVVITRRMGDSVYVVIDRYDKSGTFVASSTSLLNNGVGKVSNIRIVSKSNDCICLLYEISNGVWKLKDVQINDM